MNKSAGKVLGALLLWLSFASGHCGGNAVSRCDSVSAGEQRCAELATDGEEPDSWEARPADSDSTRCADCGAHEADPRGDDQSEVSCVPNCVGRECGSDGCGGSCGECRSEIACWELSCREDVGECTGHYITCCCTADSECCDDNPCTKEYCDQETRCCLFDGVPNC